MARIINPTLARWAARWGLTPGAPNTEGSAAARRVLDASRRTALPAAKPLPMRTPEKPAAPNATQTRGPRVFTQGATHSGTGYVGPRNIRK